MASNEGDPERQEHLLETSDLAGALESDRFRQFLDHMPVGVAVSELSAGERITYANIEFARLIGQAAAEIHGKPWDALAGSATAVDDGRLLGEAIARGEDYIGGFSFGKDDEAITVDAWSNIIEDDDGKAMFRLVARAQIVRRETLDPSDLEEKVREKDLLLRELQHRVKNNLQMITALIRLEARNLPSNAPRERFDRLAGRVEALALLYHSLSDELGTEGVDLGTYLSQIASAVMQAHAVEGIRLDMKVDTWPVSINVAMPTGLLVNELLTNALKHAFIGRDAGTITLHSLVDDDGCRVVVADDGVGLEKGTTWPVPGKLGALIVQSLRTNAQARVDVESAPDKGVRVSIRFRRANAEPEASA